MQVSAQTINPATYLIQQVAKQDREAFSQLYDRFSTLVFTLAMRMLRVRFRRRGFTPGGFRPGLEAGAKLQRGAGQPGSMDY